MLTDCSRTFLTVGKRCHHLSCQSFNNEWENSIKNWCDCISNANTDLTMKKIPRQAQKIKYKTKANLSWANSPGWFHSHLNEKTKLLTAEPTDRKNLNERKTKQKRRKLIQFVSFIRKNARWKWKSTEYSAEVCKSCMVFLRWNKIIPDLGIFLLVCFFHYIHDSVRLHFFSQNWNI